MDVNIGKWLAAYWVVERLSRIVQRKPIARKEAFDWYSGLALLPTMKFEGL
jgi:hypothetical protein